MTSPGSSTTSWAQIEDLPEDVVELHHSDMWEWYLALATDVLWASTGRRWRGASLAATASLQPAAPRHGDLDRTAPSGWHRSWGVCSCAIPGWAYIPGRAHPDPVRVRLPHDDVTRVDAVTIDGEPFTAYRLDGPWLTRTDRRGWPVCGDRAEVTYRYGRLAPLAGKAACVELAVELGKGAAGKPCNLPKRIQSITRQGISYTPDDMAFLGEGLTGLYATDLFIRSANPHGRTQAASVWSPDLLTARRTS